MKAVLDETLRLYPPVPCTRFRPILLCEWY